MFYMLLHTSQSFVPEEKIVPRKYLIMTRLVWHTIMMYVLDYIQVHRTVQILLSEIGEHCLAPSISGNTWVLFENHFEILQAAFCNISPKQVFNCLFCPHYPQPASFFTACPCDNLQGSPTAHPNKSLNSSMQFHRVSGLLRDLETV